jgi:hypothetical protein
MKNSNARKLLSDTVGRVAIVPDTAEPIIWHIRFDKPGDSVFFSADLNGYIVIVSWIFRN